MGLTLTLLIKIIIYYYQSETKVFDHWLF